MIKKDDAMRWITHVLGVLAVIIMVGEAQADEALPPPFTLREDLYLPIPDGQGFDAFVGVYKTGYDPNQKEGNETVTVTPHLLIFNEPQQFSRIKAVYEASNYVIGLIREYFDGNYSESFMVWSFCQSIFFEDEPPCTRVDFCRSEGRGSEIFEKSQAELYEIFLRSRCLKEIRKDLLREKRILDTQFSVSQGGVMKPARSYSRLPKSFYLPLE